MRTCIFVSYHYNELASEKQLRKEIEGATCMKVIAVNGSPRKNWNTATLLQKALEGSKSVGADTELIHLYENKNDYRTLYQN